MDIEQQAVEGNGLLGMKTVQESTVGSTKKVQTSTETEIGKMKTRHARRMIFSVSDVPPIPATLTLAFQHVLQSMASLLSGAIIFSDLVCASDHEDIKTKILSTTMLSTGMATFFVTTVGCRLPIFQGPSFTYIIPLITMATMSDWKCPSQEDLRGIYANTTTNYTLNHRGMIPVPDDVILSRIHTVMGSLMLAEVIHALIGATGCAGFLLRFIGPVTIVPAISLAALFLFKVALKYSQMHWGVAFLTMAIGVTLSLYLRHVTIPCPFWTPNRGFHIIRSNFHTVYAVLISILMGWGISAILTLSGALSSEPESPQYYARTDSRTYVIRDSGWFYVPYPGQFGMFTFNAGVFSSFLVSSLLSIIDSIADYSACARICHVPPPPAHAVNRGVAVEGVMSIITGGLGIGHATSSFGGNIGTIGLTKVASRCVMQVAGVLFIVFSVLPKIGAVFVTVPYPVVGGTMVVLDGLLVGVALSNLQPVDLSSTRNLAIIGMSLFVGLMMPYWTETTTTGLNTGNTKADSLLKVLVSNPMFIGGGLACILDNTVRGTRKERGLDWWEEDTAHHPGHETSTEYPYEEGSDVYEPLFIPESWKRSKWTRFFPVIPNYH
ncbi:solute carrier family 23 member 1-like [Haliotis cracherodii]|uniref:solute carrier family 23 member 1-like n=1 Tax=Haliotis cracherodii TaxID=6455 RepID=UPI0039ED638A